MYIASHCSQYLGHILISSLYLQCRNLLRKKEETGLSKLKTGTSKPTNWIWTYINRKYVVVFLCLWWTFRDTETEKTRMLCNAESVLLQNLRFWVSPWWCVLVHQSLFLSLSSSCLPPRPPETGLSACGWSDHAGPPRRPAGEEEEEEEEDAAGAQRVPTARCHAGQEKSGAPLGTGGPPHHSVHGRADGWRPRTGPEEGLPPYVPAFPRQPAAEER